MVEWFEGLETARQVFFSIAVIISALFLWQFISALIGLGGGEGVDMDAHADVGADVSADAGADHVDMHDADAATLGVFKLLSLRSIIAFLLLFSWAGFLYLGNDDVPVYKAMVYSALWGVAAMVLVSILFYQLSKLQESGNLNFSSCIGSTATVYITIPAGGRGKVRATIGGRVEFASAVTSEGTDIPAGAVVKIVGVIGGNTFEVERA